MFQTPALAAPEAEPPPAAVSPPDWVKRPTGAEIADAFPDGPLRLGVPGKAALTCRVTAVGAAADCRVIDEAPAGMGFGAAALKVSRTFRFRPQMRGGAPTETGEVTVPLRFSFPSAGQTTKPRGPGEPAALLHEAGPGEAAPTGRSGPCPDKPGALCVADPMSWAEAPEWGELAGLYGAVRFMCRVEAGGGLGGCWTAKGTPDAHVDAAKLVLRQFKAPGEVTGRATAGERVTLLIVPPGPSR